MCLNQSTPFFGRRYPSTNFMEPRECTLGTCSTVIYYNHGATGKLSVLILMSLPLFHNALEVARGKDQQH